MHFVKNVSLCSPCFLAIAQHSASVCFIQHTCVTAPEIEEGPYYVNNEYIRKDIREDQQCVSCLSQCSERYELTSVVLNFSQNRGISLILDVAVIDTATCELVPNAFVELWSGTTTFPSFYCDAH